MGIYNKGYGQALTEISSYLGISVGLASFFVVIIIVWTLVWKGLALWKSAKKNHFIWFVVLLVVNTLGILEILYIYLFSEFGEKKSLKKDKTSKKKKK